MEPTLDVMIGSLLSTALPIPGWWRFHSLGERARVFSRRWRSGPRALPLTSLSPGMWFWICLTAVVTHASLGSPSARQIRDNSPNNSEEPRSQRLLFDELFWFGGSSSSPDDDEKPGLASCSCRKLRHKGIALRACFDWKGWYRAGVLFFEGDRICLLPYGSPDIRWPLTPPLPIRNIM
ncbi:uncharacterized protein LOC124363646 [Homalodisca vitripennis]|uniref:uncharacterized protein LOC124363646 n=1 Tax=Homalodisca vitripennis TaxID=197043 RepID=UPI001EE9CA8B|nr:uncharacterized protein LOC124363646 [Homalodisca vitripennis]